MRLYYSSISPDGSLVSQAEAMYDDSQLVANSNYMGKPQVLENGDLVVVWTDLTETLTRAKIFYSKRT